MSRERVLLEKQEREEEIKAKLCFGGIFLFLIVSFTLLWRGGRADEARIINWKSECETVTVTPSFGLDEIVEYGYSPYLGEIDKKAYTVYLKKLNGIGWFDHVEPGDKIIVPVMHVDPNDAW